MPLRVSGWSVPLLLAGGVWAGIALVSAEPTGAGPGDPATAPAPDSKTVEPASLDAAAEDGATEDTLALGGDPIENSRLLPLSGFS